MAEGTGNQQKGKDSAMAAHLKKSGYPHGRRMSAPSWPFNPKQIGSNKYVRRLRKEKG